MEKKQFSHLLNKSVRMSQLHSSDKETLDNVAKLCFSYGNSRANASSINKRNACSNISRERKQEKGIKRALMHNLEMKYVSHRFIRSLSTRLNKIIRLLKLSKFLPREFNGDKTSQLLHKYAYVRTEC